MNIKQRAMKRKLILNRHRATLLQSRFYIFYVLFVYIHFWYVSRLNVIFMIKNVVSDFGTRQQ